MTAPDGGAGHAELAALHAAYARGLPERVGGIVAAFERWRRTPEQVELLGELETQVHRLRGSAGSYGLASLSRAMGAVEECLRRARLAGDRRVLDLDAIERALGEAGALASQAAERREAGASKSAP